jgi:hypothetical protein
MNTWHVNTGNIDRSYKRFIFSNLGQPDTQVALSAGQGWGVKGKRRQQSLFCLKGRVWVTQECDIHDYLLEAGDAFLITLPGLVLVHALTHARIGYAESLAPEPFSGPFRQTVFN